MRFARGDVNGSEKITASPPSSLDDFPPWTMTHFQSRF